MTKKCDRITGFWLAEPSDSQFTVVADDLNFGGSYRYKGGKTPRLDRKGRASAVVKQDGERIARFKIDLFEVNQLVDHGLAVGSLSLNTCNGRFKLFDGNDGLTFGAGQLIESTLT